MSKNEKAKVDPNSDQRPFRDALSETVVGSDLRPCFFKRLFLYGFKAQRLCLPRSSPWKAGIKTGRWYWGAFAGKNV